MSTARHLQPAYQVSNMLDFRPVNPMAPTMPAATLTAKGQIVIPAEIRARYELTPGTQLEFVDEGGVIRLVIRRRVAASDPAAGYGLVKIPPPRKGGRRLLSDFDPALTLARSRHRR